MEHQTPTPSTREKIFVGSRQQQQFSDSNVSKLAWVQVNTTNSICIFYFEKNKINKKCLFFNCFSPSSNQTKQKKKNLIINRPVDKATSLRETRVAPSNLILRGFLGLFSLYTLARSLLMACFCSHFRLL